MSYWLGNWRLHLIFSHKERFKKWIRNLFVQDLKWLYDEMNYGNAPLLEPGLNVFLMAAIEIASSSSSS